MCIVAVTIFLQVSPFLSSSVVAMLTSRPAGVWRINRWKKNSSEQGERIGNSRLSVFNWNPGLRRGNADAFVKQSAGKWHIITLQEATDDNDHSDITKRFHFNHHGGCAVLVNKDTFYSEIEASSIYLHDTRRESHDQAAEGEARMCYVWCPRATFKRQAAKGQKNFTVLCTYATSLQRSGIAKKLILAIRTIMTSHQVDPVAGDFNGTAWRSTSKGNSSRSTIEEAFSDCNLPTPTGPIPLWGPGSILGLWTDVCGFLKPPDSHRFWEIRKHGAFAIAMHGHPCLQYAGATTRTCSAQGGTTFTK